MATQGGPAQPVSVQTGGIVQGGAAIPVAVVSDGRATLGGPAQPVVVVTSGPVQGGPALPVVAATGAQAARIAAGPALKVYVVSGSFLSAAPVNTALPVITGTPAIGQIFSTTNGTWSNNPTSYTYQWKRGGVAIGGATASTYTVQAADAGTTITVTVTATNAIGSASATSAGVAVSSLVDAVAYWTLNEAALTRVDSTGRGNDLSPTNAPGNIAGKVGSAVQLTAASTQQLSKTDTADLSIGNASFTIDGWIYFDAVPGAGVYRGIWGKWGPAGVKEWIIYHDGDINRLVLNVSSNGTATTFVIANTFGAPSPTTWYYVAAGYDRANNQIWISVNNGARNNTAYISDIFDGAQPFSVGRPDTTIGADYWNGRIDETGVWKRTLTAAELTARYNGGAGSTFPFDGTLPVAFHVASASDVATMRSTLIGRIWSGGGYPAAGADSVTTGVPDPLSSSSANLLRVDQLTIDCGGGFISSPYVWYPITSINKLVLHHNGHSLNFEDGAQGDYIRALIDAGYTVVGLTMIGNADVAVHNTYPVPTGLLNYLRYFLEPPARAMNQLSAGFSTTFMSGLSGGGWQTTLPAALDTRIKRSVPFAGQFPLFIADPSRDWEQFLPGLYDIVDFQDLYVMACDGGRRQLECHNTNDPCCFYRTEYNTYPFAAAVAAQATVIGGTWLQYWDSSSVLHEISSAARAQILAFLSAA